MADITSNQPLGQDAIKGGIFFGSNLTPSGAFPNVPTYTTSIPPTLAQENRLVLTLQQVQEELQASAAIESGVSSDSVLSTQSINTYLTGLIQLLIDYRDLRNSVFFGSAYTELAYHINQIIINYPYLSYFAQDVNIHSGIEINSLSGGLTRIAFFPADVQEIATYTYDTSGATVWTDFDIVDSNQSRFPILGLNLSSNVLNLTYVNATSTSTFTITTEENHFLIPADTISIVDVLGVANANGSNIIILTTPTDTTFTFSIPTTSTGTYTSGGTITPVGELILLVQGNISINNLIQYQPTPPELFKGLLVSPKIQVITDFNVNLPGEQKALLSSQNMTPWPRMDITQNVNTSGGFFDAWVANPTNMAPIINGQDLGIESTDFGLNLTGSLALDETDTNQLLRRAIPERLVDELNDMDDSYFSRFVLVAGKFFDTMKVYIDFLKYTHSLNYTSFNQLSPDFYKQYAENYGFDLFDDDTVDLAKAVIRTEPGLRYDSLNNAVFDNRTDARTVQQLQHEKQKRLLLNLFYLYKTKGTQKCIKFLTSLLGAPEGLIVLDEFCFNQSTGLKETDNDKFTVPTISYEIDPNYLTNTTNINDPSNLPYVYRLKLDNDTKINLRDIKIVTDPQGAIADQILNFGKTIYPYASFTNGSYANLQNTSQDYFLLPLSFPDKYIGLTTEYMIPKDGYSKGVAFNLDEVTIHIGSLYEVAAISYDLTNPLVPIPQKIPCITQFSYPIPAMLIDSLGGTSTPQVQNQLNPSGAPLNTNLQQIIARVEGKDLVIRLKLRDETSRFISLVKRVTIMRNVFNADGLNHQLRLIYRPEGVEVYQDYKYIGLALWLDPTYLAPGPVLVTFEPIDAPKALFNRFSPLSIPNIYAYPNKNAAGLDSSRWFDLLIGLPQNIDMKFSRVAVFDSLAITLPDVLDSGLSSSGEEDEKYSFSLKNQILDPITLVKKIDSISTFADYRAPNPEAIGTQTTFETFFTSHYSNNQIIDINLISKDSLGGFATYSEQVQGFYNLPNGQIITLDSLFTYNTWSPTIHQDYNYNTYYNLAYENYQIFSNEVLTYLSLLPFMELVESKFYALVTQFIPIVINISDYGRLIRSNPFDQNKARYTNIHFNCDGTSTAVLAEASFNLISGTYVPGVNQLTVTIGALPTINIDWQSTNNQTLNLLATSINSLYHSTTNIQATVQYNYISLQVDPNWYFSTYGIDVNTVVLHVAVHGNVKIRNLKGFTGGELGLVGTCDKFTITRTSAPIVVQPTYPYIYYRSENGVASYIYNDSESLPPLYIS